MATNAFEQTASNPTRQETQTTFGSWVHTLREDDVRAAFNVGFTSTRGYIPEHAEVLRDFSLEHGISQLSGLYVDGDLLIRNWESQLHPGDLRRLLDTGVEQIAVCIGNEVRARCGFSHRFSPLVAQNLLLLLLAYRTQIEESGAELHLTYAMEASALDNQGDFFPWVRPLLHAVDVVAINLYPLAPEDWVGTQAFDRNRAFLTDMRVRSQRFERFEGTLRRILDQLHELGKPLILSETGLPSGVDYTIEGTFYRPVHDNDAFASAYEQLTEILMTVNEEYHEQIMGIYIYEWLDNHHHPKIQLENSPIHNCFGLADENGIPKFDLSTIHTMTRG